MTETEPAAGEQNPADRRALPPVPQDPSSFLENMLAPELYATFASSFSVTAGSVTIKLVSSRWDNSVEPAVQKAVVVGRVTMPLQGAQTLVAGLQNFLAQHGSGVYGADTAEDPRKRRRRLRSQSSQALKRDSQRLLFFLQT